MAKSELLDLVTTAESFNIWLLQDWHKFAENYDHCDLRFPFYYYYITTDYIIVPSIITFLVFQFQMVFE